MMGELIIENLKVNYDKKNVINGLNLSIEKGELIVILGPSGCGKSTLLYAISGLLDPFEGDILFNNKFLFSKAQSIKVKVENRNIGFVFQDYALWPHMTVYKNIAYPLVTKKITKPEINKKVDEVLEMVNLKDKKDAYPGELSGGEKQRVALARSVVLKPALILLDEPLANIDANLKMQLMHGIKSIQRSTDSTMIYVTHDQNEAFEMADRIVIMREGEIVQQGSPKEVYMKPKNLFVASFVGNSNLVKPDQLKHIFLDKNCGNCICIRPEDIRIKGNGRYCGRVLKNKFRGQKSECIISYNDIELLVNNDNSSLINEGEEVRFDVEKYFLVDE